MISREDRIINELQLVTGVCTKNISYLCYLLLKDGSYFKDVKTEDEVVIESNELELNKKVKELEVKSFDDLLNIL